MECRPLLGSYLGVQCNAVQWNGMEWNAMEWNGMEWNGMAWNGVEWNAMARHGMACNGMQWHATGDARLLVEEVLALLLRDLLLDLLRDLRLQPRELALLHQQRERQLEPRLCTVGTSVIGERASAPACNRTRIA